MRLAWLATNYAGFVLTFRGTAGTQKHHACLHIIAGGCFCFSFSFDAPYGILARIESYICGGMHVSFYQKNVRMAYNDQHLASGYNPHHFCSSSHF